MNGKLQKNTVIYRGNLYNITYLYNINPLDLVIYGMTIFVMYLVAFCGIIVFVGYKEYNKIHVNKNEKDK